jgi:hypothetical protein
MWAHGVHFYHELLFLGQYRAPGLWQGFFGWWFGISWRKLAGDVFPHRRSLFLSFSLFFPAFLIFAFIFIASVFLVLPPTRAR